VPKISADTIAEHVEQQTTAILDAAARLFAERGVSGTDLRDIAEAVGLARSSLYRYFPDKDHILLMWFERELEPVITHSRELAEANAPVDERLDLWLRYQLDYVTDPAHDLGPKLAQEVGAVSPEVQAAIGAGHARLYATLTTLATESLEGQPGRDGEPGRDPRLVVMLLGGLVRAAADAVMTGTDPAAAKTELVHAARALLAEAPPAPPPNL